MRKGKVVWYILVGMNLILLLLLGLQYGRNLRMQEDIAGKVLRFHVLANSDSREDQALKLAVRDAVGAGMAEVLAGAGDRETCEKIINANLNRIKATAERVVEEWGLDYEVEAALEEVDFPVKTYGDYTFPAGKYEALRVVIGEGEGHNWWCVMYPNMCFSGSVYEVVDEETEGKLREVLDEEEYETVLSSGDYEVRLKCLDFLREP